MQPRRTGLLLLVMAVAACGGASTREARRPRFGGLRAEWRSELYRPDIQRFELANGLVVVLMPDARTNLVSVDVRYRVGSAEDPAGKSGLAHLAEHLAFELRPAADAPGLGTRLGAVSLGHNAYTGFDETHYQELALHQDLAIVLGIEAERMSGRCDQIPADVFERERQVVLRELAQRDTAPARLEQAVRASLYPQGHPYTRPVGGADVAGLTLADVCGFLADHYAPGRAILIVGGRFDPAAVRTLVDERFGSIDRVARGARVEAPPLAVSGGRVRIEAEVEEATALVVFPMLPLGTPEAVRAHATVQMLATRMWGISDDHPWITAIDVGRIGGDRAGAAYLSLSVRREQDVQRAVDLLFAEERQLADEEDASRRLRLVCNRLLFELLGSMSELTERGGKLADYQMYGGDASLVSRDWKLLDNLTVNDLDPDAFTRPRTQLLIVVPRRAGAATIRRTVLPASAVALDVMTTRAPVDAAEAQRPMPLPVAAVGVDVRSLTLANGLRVLLAPRDDAQVLDARLIFPVGSAADPAGQAGMAELAANLLEHDFDARFRRDDFYDLRFGLGIGTDVDVEVDRTDTRFRARGLTLHAEWHVWRLHWLLEDGVYVDRTFRDLRERAAGRSRDGDDATSAILRRELGGASDLNAAIQRVDLDELRAFRSTHYRAAGATLIVVGRFDAGEMERVIRALWGTWAGGRPRPPVAGAAAPPAPRGRHLHAIDDSSTQPSIAVAFRLRPAGATVATTLLLRALIVQRIEAVRERLGASYGLATTVQGNSLVIRGQVDAERAGEALRLLLADLAALRAGPQAEEFVRARRWMLGNVLAESADVASIADRLELIATNGLPPDYLERLARAIAGTTLAEIAAAVRTDLDLDHMTLLVTGRAAVVQRALQAAGIRDSQLVK
jgi:zinc protease